MVAHNTLQRRKEELASRVECLEKRIDELVKTKAELEFQMGEARKREDELGNIVADLRAENDAGEERLREVRGWVGGRDTASGGVGCAHGLAALGSMGVGLV